MNKALQTLLKALSEPEAEVNVSRTRNLMNLKSIDMFKKFYRTVDDNICSGGAEIPLRIYFPTEHVCDTQDNTCPVLLFFHGGGFVSENVETYNRICWNMSRNTQHVVASVDYRLAPEHRFPIPFDDCYAAAEAVFKNRTLLHVKPEHITVIGDSAGANLAAAVSQKARDTGDFKVHRQILIYPCVGNDYSDDTPFASVKENGFDYLLTQKNLQDYMNLYQSGEEDRQNPYFAPLQAEHYRDLPDTLIITGEFDPLRDEGEEYARRLQDAGVSVRMHRIMDAVHGFFLLPTRYPAVKETYEYINDFLKGVENSVSGKENEVEELGEHSQDLSCYER